MRKKRWRFDKNNLIARLSRVEGQVRSLKIHIDGAHEPTYIMQQLKAAREAIDQIGTIAMLEYIKADLKDAKDPVAQFEKYEELVKKYGW